MESKRRDFLKLVGLGGLGIAGSSLDGFASGPSSPVDAMLPHKNMKYEQSRVQHFNMSGYAAPKIETVRIGIIGLGKHGSSHLKTMIRIEGVEIKALCDLRPEKVTAANKQLENTDHNPELYSGSEQKWNGINKIIVAA